MDVCNDLPGVDNSVCRESVRNSIVGHDWMESVVQAFRSIPPNSLQMSRHEVFSLLSRLRRYPSPRRLLVIGGSHDDALLWNEVNSKAKGGTSCFVTRNEQDSRPLEMRFPFIRVVQEVEDRLSGNATSQMPLVRQESGRVQIEIKSNFSHVPWDVILLYDICFNEDDRTYIPYEICWNELVRIIQ